MSDNPDRDAPQPTEPSDESTGAGMAAWGVEARRLDEVGLPAPRATLAEQSLIEFEERLRGQQQVPPDPFLCGFADGTLRQLVPSLAAEVRRRADASVLARFEIGRFWDAMVAWERLRALWRKVPVRLKIILALALFTAAVVAGVQAGESHRQRSSKSWKRFVGNAHWYFLGGTHDSLRDVDHYSRIYGAYPAVVDDPAEHLWLSRTFIAGLRRPPESGAAPQVLLGYREIGREGGWQTATGVPLRYSRWYTAEPNNDSGDVGEVVVWDPMTLGWRDIAPPTGGPGSPNLLVLFEHPGDPYAWTARELYTAPLLLLLGLLLAGHIVAVLLARARIVLLLDLRDRTAEDMLRSENVLEGLGGRW